MRIKEVRRSQKVSAAELAERCKKLGAPHITASVIANVETRRRQEVSIDNLLTIAEALNVAPIHLLVPIADEEQEKLYAVSPESWTPAIEAREWIRGRVPLYGQDPRVYFSQVPRQEWEPPKLTEREIERESEKAQFRDRSGER